MGLFTKKIVSPKFEVSFKKIRISWDNFAYEACAISSVKRIAYGSNEAYFNLNIPSTFDGYEVKGVLPLISSVELPLLFASNLEFIAFNQRYPIVKFSGSYKFADSFIFRRVSSSGNQYILTNRIVQPHLDYVSTYGELHNLMDKTKTMFYRDDGTSRANIFLCNIFYTNRYVVEVLGDLGSQIL